MRTAKRLITEGRARLQSRSIALETDDDIAVARGEARSVAAALGFGAIDQTRLATVASELSRNVVKYARRGRMIAQPVRSPTGREGLRLIFEDKEHTSELQSLAYIVCRLLLEKKKKYRVSDITDDQ